MKVSVCSNRSILTSCELENFNYQVDTYVGCEHFCYYCYVLAQAESDWSKEIFKHNDIVARLSEEIVNIPSQTIYMGYHTDPYQPCEVEHQQTRKVLELFQEKGHSTSILTKSDLVVRDIDILKKMENAAVSVSVAFNDNRIRNLFEANTMETHKRIFNSRFPDIKDQIESAIFSKDHDYWTQLRKNLESLKKDQGLNLNIHL